MGEALEGAGEHPAALSLPAHSLAKVPLPRLRAVDQICLCHPGAATASPSPSALSQKSSSPAAGQS